MTVVLSILNWSTPYLLNYKKQQVKSSRGYNIAVKKDYTYSVPSKKQIDSKISRVKSQGKAFLYLAIIIAIAAFLYAHFKNKVLSVPKPISSDSILFRKILVQPNIEYNENITVEDIKSKDIQDEKIDISIDDSILVSLKDKKGSKNIENHDHLQ
ncbi:MAG: hypothetical protein ISR65_09525 [Bacteriovoracaceae bacterium]|nr:hypothetical protein [Bacteriovoracaceae bacterium]